MNGNCNNWLELAGNSRSDWIWPEMTEYSWTWLDMARTRWEQLEIAGMTENGWK